MATVESALNFEELGPPRRVVFVVEKKDFPQSSFQSICVKSSLSVVGYQAGTLIRNSGDLKPKSFTILDGLFSD